MRTTHVLAGVVTTLALLGAAVGRSHEVAVSGPLQAQVEALVANPSEWGLMAYSLDRNEVLFAINADSLRIPASNNKVFSSIWALELLGPDHRFATDLLVAGEVRDSVLQGDVYLRGSADPAFGHPAYDRDPLASVRGMARALQRIGVRRVQGSIVGDGSLHGGPNYGPAWPKDTGNGAAKYAPTVSALPFQGNLVMVGARGDSALTTPYVPEIPLKWERRGGRAMTVRNPTDDTLRLRGSPRVNDRYPIGPADAAMLAPAAVREALGELGITVSGPVRLGKTPASAVLVHQHFSVPLGEMVYKLNQESDNFFAEHVWKAATAKAVGSTSFALGGPNSARFFRRFAGVPYGQLWQADGSGLSAHNQITANAMVLALKAADRASWSEAFHRSLPIAANRAGTLSSMFRPGMPAADNLHAKTGYIRHVRTLSGYVRTADGERVAFSMLYNGRSDGGARKVQQDIGNLLAGYRR
jgi:serine-type D-Ala-D-Ala carboxypeptidase/endopeptidase (penicillin-binding protein 4)